MSPSHESLARSAPLAGLIDELGSRSEGGVFVCERSGLGIATVLARKAAVEALLLRVHQQFGVELPQAPCRVSSGNVAFVATAPSAWLATCENKPNVWATSLRETTAGLASVADQSDGYTVVRLSGAKVRQTLAKLVPIDLHARVFKVGSAAVTVAAHVGILLWRLDDAADGSPTFEIALFRSFSESFWHALTESAAEFGLRCSDICGAFEPTPVQCVLAGS